MTPATPSDSTFEEDFTLEELERAQLLAWASLSAAAKLDFFEEIVALAWQSGALAPERLALRDRAARGERGP